MASKLSAFFAELKRRKVYHVGAAYAAVAVGVSLAVAELFNTFTAPEWAAKAVIAVIVLGFPIALVLAWAYEVRPEEPKPPKPSEKEPPPSAQTTVRTPFTAVGHRKSIVVLPFDNMSPDPGDGYFSDGLTEEIITNLSHIRSLRVISRNSAMVLKNTQKDTRSIALELDVEYVLEGSVRKAGDDLRITAQLIDAASDAHLWAKKYDGRLENVFDMQEQVSRSIVLALELQLTPEEDKQIGQRRIDNIPAYECYLKAMGEVWRQTPDSIDRASQYLQDAIEIIGPNTYLYGGLALVQWARLNIGLAEEEALALGEEYVSKALALDPESPVALSIRGSFQLAFGGRVREGIHLLRRALRANPDEPQGLTFLAVAYVNFLGWFEAAKPLVEQLVEVDPLGPLTHWLRGALPFFQGDPKRASVVWRRTHEMWPESPIPQFYYALALAYAEDREESLEVLQSPEPPVGGDVGSRFCRILRCALLHDEAGALRELTPEFRQTLKRDGTWAHLVAAPLAFVGAVDEALELLKQAVAVGFINYPMLAEHDPFLSKLRGEPRYESLLEDVKRKWEAFEV